MLCPSMQRTVTLHVGRVPEIISSSVLVHMFKECFGMWKLLVVQFLPGLKAHLTFDSEEARAPIEGVAEVDIGSYTCRVTGGAPRGEKVPG